jgi:hypothetical protein
MGAFSRGLCRGQPGDIKIAGRFNTPLPCLGNPVATFLDVLPAHEFSGRAWGTAGGRVYSTAMAALTLETEWREE